MKYHENTGELLDFQDRGHDIFNEMKVGDIMFADFGWGEKGHVMTITGWSSEGGKRVPLLTYHTSDRIDWSLTKIDRSVRNQGKVPRFWGLHIQSNIR